MRAKPSLRDHPDTTGAIFGWGAVGAGSAFVRHHIFRASEAEPNNFGTDCADLFENPGDQFVTEQALINQPPRCDHYVTFHFKSKKEIFFGETLEIYIERLQHRNGKMCS